MAGRCSIFESQRLELSATSDNRFLVGIFCDGISWRVIGISGLANHSRLGCCWWDNLPSLFLSHFILETLYNINSRFG